MSIRRARISARYRGASCITPNLRELAAAARLPVASDAEVIAAATKVMQDSGADAIVVTRSDKGMVLVEASGAVHIEPARAREVYDVSGAGDTVVAVLALARAAGYALPQAMRLANTAAGIVVSKLGTATVELDELMLELARDVRDKEWHRAKHFSAAEAETLVRRWKGRGLKVGFTNGCFDIVHAGHVALLAAARAAMRPADRRAERRCRGAAAQGTEAAGQRAAGPRRGDRRRRVGRRGDQLRRGHAARIDPPPAPDVLVKGGDYTVETVVGAKEVQEAGGRVVLVDLVEGHSTTGLIDAIRTGRAGRGRRDVAPDAGRSRAAAGLSARCSAAALNEAGRADLVIVDRFGSDEKWRNIAKRDFSEILPVDGLLPWLDRFGRRGRGDLSSRRDLGDDLRRCRRDDRQQPQLFDRAVALVRRQRAGR